MHVVEAGNGPLVLLLHGFPEGWYSWRHQLTALAEAGYHAVAPDQRGYGRTERPADVRAYSMFHLAGDVVGLTQALGESNAVVVGHDWGGTVAWNASLFRPDVVRAVAVLASARRPRGASPPLDAVRETYGARYYQTYYQEPGVAEREFEADVRRTILAFLCGESAQATQVYDLTVGETGMLEKFEILEPLPPWLTEEDVDYWTGEYRRTGFTGGLNWYRNSTANWEMLAPWTGALISVPAIYMVGDRDVTQYGPRGKQTADGLRASLADLKKIVVLPDCGHWTQQERPDEVTTELLDFLESGSRRAET